MKNLNKYDIAVFGDSIVKGLFLNGNRVERTTVNAVSLVEQHYNISINNISRFGQTLKKFCQRNDLDSFLADKRSDKQKIAVISLGGNDADHDWKAISQSPSEIHSSLTDLNKYQELLNNCIEKIKSSNAIAIVATILPVDSKRYFDYVISKNFDGQAVLEFFKGDITNINRCQENFNSTILTVASKHNCPVIDARRKFLSQVDFLDYFCHDGIHPNDKGQQLLTNSIIDFIEAVDLNNFN